MSEFKGIIEENCKKFYEENIDNSNIPRGYYEWEIIDLIVGFSIQQINCELSELLEQRNEMLEMLGNILEYELLPNDIVNEIEQLIKKVKDNEN